MKTSILILLLVSTFMSAFFIIFFIVGFICGMKFKPSKENDVLKINDEESAKAIEAFSELLNYDVRGGK